MCAPTVTRVLGSQGWTVLWVQRGFLPRLSRRLTPSRKPTGWQERGHRALLGPGSPPGRCACCGQWAGHPARVRGEASYGCVTLMAIVTAAPDCMGPRRCPGELTPVPHKASLAPPAGRWLQGQVFVPQAPNPVHTSPECHRGSRHRAIAHVYFSKPGLIAFGFLCCCGSFFLKGLASE